MLRGMITRITRAVKHIKALDEILEALAEEMERSERLERELEREKRLRVELENRLTEFSIALKNRERELKFLKQKISELERELSSVLEASLLKYLQSSKGTLPIKEYIQEYGTTQERIIEALKSLHRKGLIKIAREKEP